MKVMNILPVASRLRQHSEMKRMDIERVENQVVGVFRENFMKGRNRAKPGFDYAQQPKWKCNGD